MHSKWDRLPGIEALVDSFSQVDQEMTIAVENAVETHFECLLPEPPDPSQNYLQLRNKRGKGKGIR